MGCVSRTVGVIWVASMVVAATCARSYAGPAEAKEFLETYLKASWPEQQELRSKLVELGPEIIPIAVSQMKNEKFSREKLPHGWEAPLRNSADVLGILATTDEHRASVIDLMKPLLVSKDPNERGWSNYVLSMVHFPGELDNMSELIRNEDVGDVLCTILNRLYYTLLNNRDVAKQKDTESAWRETLVRTLGDCLKSKDDSIVVPAAGCLTEIPSPQSTAIAVEAIVKGQTNPLHFESLLRQRIGTPGPAALTLEQQRAVVGALIETKMKRPQTGSDTWTDIIMDIQDKRVLLAFFQMLETYKDNATVQRQASYSIWIVFTRTPELRAATPGAVYDMRAIDGNPKQAGEVWRQWYQANKERLTWDEADNCYRLQGAKAK